MSPPPSQPPDANDPPSDLATLLRTQRSAIVSRFVEDVPRQRLGPPGLSRALLVDHVPLFIDEIVEELSRPARRQSLDQIEESPAAQEHGGQRWSLGYDLEGLIREYGVLRHCILRAAKESGVAVSIDEFDTLASCINVGVVEAAAAYMRQGDERERAQREALAFLAEAGEVLTASLDRRSTLSRLTRLVVPKLADWCAVHVEGVSVDDMPIVHVDPDKEQLVRDIYRRFPIPADATWGYPGVLKSKEPAIVSEVDDAFFERTMQSPAHLAAVRALEPKSFMIVPLKVQDEIFGAITFVYGPSGRRYEEADLFVGTELARRAAIAIDNARLYERSQEERSRVEAATRVKDEFVAMVSHELRTPLNSILGWTRLLRSGDLEEGKRDHALEVVERSALAQNQLVSDLLDVSRVITGKLRIHPAQVDVKNLLEMAVEGIRPAANAKSIAIQPSLANDLQIRADGDRLAQVFWNLLTNAVKFTPKCGRITVEARRDASDVIVMVSDTGRGIPADFLPHVFENFRQLDGSTARSHGGLGIGLSVAQHIVELHGGSITPHSDGVDQGARFVVRLPVMPLVSTTMGISKVPAATSESSQPALPRGAAGLRVLVVDDESDARDLIGYLLQASGMEVQLASSAAEALEAYEAFDADVLVSDIGMPGEDGYSLIRSVRTLAKEPKRGIPAIALTAFARNEDRARALVAGFNVHIAKPVEPAALVDAVVELAGKSRAAG
jgi:signal transduction histidine kinase/ActR/RegA family two-component response regulator